MKNATKKSAQTPGPKENGWDFDGEDVMQGDLEIALINRHHFDARAIGILIAAAPELLAALKEALPLVEEEATFAGVESPMLKRFRAAIAKASGESK